MSILKKLFEAKKEIGAITKDAKNPFFKSNYFDINSLLREIEPILEKNELILLQPIEDGKVKTIIFSIDEDGSKDNVFSEMQLPNIQDPQKLGSAITYYRRYTLQSLLGLQSEDDDGNKASRSINFKKPSDKLKECKTLTELQNVYLSLTRTEQTAMTSLKDELKLKLK